jgi:hypothetical protein
MYKCLQVGHNAIKVLQVGCKTTKASSLLVTSTSASSFICSAMSHFLLLLVVPVLLVQGCPHSGRGVRCHGVEDHEEDGNSGQESGPGIDFNCLIFKNIIFDICFRPKTFRAKYHFKVLDEC